VGGHCIPFYPYFVIEPFEGETKLLETARAVNDGMPSFTVGKLREEFNAEGTSLAESSVLILGLTYRPGVEEIRASPSIDIASELSAAGADVYGVDPMLDDTSAFDLKEIGIDAVYEQQFDAVVLVTPHDDFDDIRWEAIRRGDGQLVVIDGRDTLELGATDHRVYTIGSGYV
jgi:UDP-N-acetyl-D-mannosaminuronic acid dehydrogenase